jgi:hypothetical protein
LQDHQRHDRDRPAEVECFRRGSQHLLRVPDIGRYVRGGTFAGAGQQRPGVGKHHRVVVDVDNPGIRGNALGHLMSVLRGRQPGAEIKELPDPRFRGQVAHRAAEECPVGTHAGQDGRVGGDHLLRGLPVGGLPVGGEVVLAA